jgi:hypothetical protein
MPEFRKGGIQELPPSAGQEGHLLDMDHKADLTSAFGHTAPTA